MGRNAEIKRFESRPPGQLQDLFSSFEGKAPVVTELLRTPWVHRASDLASGEGSGKRAEIPVEVEWDPERGRPAWFLHRGKRHVVDSVASQWSIERGWWDRSRAESRRCFRVLARGGVWDLAYDRLRGSWWLIGVVD